jgi:hypothetical protein
MNVKKQFAPFLNTENFSEVSLGDEEVEDASPASWVFARPHPRAASKLRGGEGAVYIFSQLLESSVFRQNGDEAAIKTHILEVYRKILHAEASGLFNSTVS